MTAQPLIVGFEGPCLVGKTYIIKQLAGKLEARGWQVLCIPEYTEYAGGYRNLPPLFPENATRAKKNAQFLIELEGKRRQDIEVWIDRQQNHTPSIVLVDRLLLTCLLIARRVNDSIGYETILKAIKARQMIIPGFTIFLRMTLSPEEYARRLRTRILFENSDVIYDPAGYEAFFTSFSEKILSIQPLCYDSTNADGIFDGVFHKAMEVFRDGSPT
jgi:thymidylate kinase